MACRRLVASISACFGTASLAVFLLGCTGEIGGEDPKSIDAYGPSSGGAASIPPGEEGDIGIAPVGRLNRTHYDNSVRDILATAQTPAADGFPGDELVLGFDAIAGVLRVQPEHVEKFLAASDALITEFLARSPTDPVRTRYVTCDVSAGGGCLGEVIRNFASAAWRRPVPDVELTPFVALAQAQPTADLALSVGFRAILTSAKFLYRWELDPSPDDPTPHLVSGYEIASRLSYALRATTPDAELLGAAESGALATTDGVLAQTRRLLDSGAGLGPLVDTFGAQWLNVNQVNFVVPDATEFPSFDDELRSAMVGEAKAFIGEFLQNDLPVVRLFDADFSYESARLAEHYGTSPRSGLLTLGSYLTSTSNPTRTSPVKRGYYVLERLLCSPPPAPPPGIDLNIDEGSGLENLPVRERLEKHQQKGSSCLGCHQTMDAIGLGLENFDAVGAYREADGFGPIDATGQLSVGGTMTPFDGAAELATLLAADERTLPCVVNKLMTFTMGRQIGPLQEPLDAAIVSATQQQGGSLRAAIEAIVVSDMFRMRRAATATEVAQ